MRIFVTGAAGFIGRAVVKELLNNGYQVLGLARSDKNAQILTGLGAEVHRGDLEDPESLKSGAKATDGVIHLAYIHDFTKGFAQSNVVDRAAIEAFGEALAGTGKPLVIAGGTLSVTAKGGPAAEDTEPDKNNPMSDRFRAQEIVQSLSKEKNIRGQTVRLAPTVHDKDDWGFIHMLIKGAQERGSVIYVDDGSARWPAIHRSDAARLFRLALEKGSAGATYHAVAEQGVAMKDIMGLMSKRLGLPLESKTLDEAVKAMGFFGNVIALDNPISSDKTQKELGWKPTGLGLLADMEANYFS